jgi:hypothetical protein
MESNQWIKQQWTVMYIDNKEESKEHILCNNTTTTTKHFIPKQVGVGSNSYHISEWNLSWIWTKESSLTEVK